MKLVEIRCPLPGAIICAGNYLIVAIVTSPDPPTLRASTTFICRAHGQHEVVVVDNSSDRPRGPFGGLLGRFADYVVHTLAG